MVIFLQEIASSTTTTTTSEQKHSSNKNERAFAKKHNQATSWRREAASFESSHPLLLASGCFTRSLKALCWIFLMEWPPVTLSLNQLLLSHFSFITSAYQYPSKEISSTVKPNSWLLFSIVRMIDWYWSIVLCCSDRPFGFIVVCVMFEVVEEFDRSSFYDDESQSHLIILFHFSLVISKYQFVCKQTSKQTDFLAVVGSTVLLGIWSITVRDLLWLVLLSVCVSWWVVIVSWLKDFSRRLEKAHEEKRKGFVRTGDWMTDLPKGYRYGTCTRLRVPCVRSHQWNQGLCAVCT